MILAKKMIRKHFNKNLVMSAEERFQSRNQWWICNKLLEVGDN